MMAGDWIKMRMDLQTHPKIVRIMSETKSDKFRAIGGLHAVWCVFDQHSVDGKLHGYTPELMDQIIGWDGFSKAMIAVGWLAIDNNNSLQMPDFEAHNGKSAKTRAEDSKRKKQSRKCPENVQNNQDKTKTREEKRREEKNKRKNKQKEIPEGFCLHDGLIEYAKTKGVVDRQYLEDFTEEFITSCKAKGYKYADFDAAWKNWFRKKLKENPTNQPRKRKSLGEHYDS